MKLSTLAILILLTATVAFAQTPAPSPGQPPPHAVSSMDKPDGPAVPPLNDPAGITPLSTEGEPPGGPTTGMPKTPMSFSGVLGVMIGAVLLMGMLAALAFSNERQPPRHA